MPLREQKETSHLRCVVSGVATFRRFAVLRLLRGQGQEGSEKQAQRPALGALGDSLQRQSSYELLCVRHDLEAALADFSRSCFVNESFFYSAKTNATSLRKSRSKL